MSPSDPEVKDEAYDDGGRRRNVASTSEYDGQVVVSEVLGRVAGREKPRDTKEKIHLSGADHVGGPNEY